MTVPTVKKEFREEQAPHARRTERRLRAKAENEAALNRADRT
jgi:hypothetical protein